MDVIRSVLGAEEEKKHISHGSHQNVTAAKELSVVSKTNLFIIVLLSRASEERGSTVAVRFPPTGVRCNEAGSLHLMRFKTRNINYIENYGFMEKGEPETEPRRCQE